MCHYNLPFEDLIRLVIKSCNQNLDFFDITSFDPKY